jgi:hypothetical protein
MKQPSREGRIRAGRNRKEYSCYVGAGGGREERRSYEGREGLVKDGMLGGRVGQDEGGG